MYCVYIYILQYAVYGYVCTVYMCPFERCKQPEVGTNFGHLFDKERAGGKFQWEGVRRCVLWTQTAIQESCIEGDTSL